MTSSPDTSPRNPLSVPSAVAAALQWLQALGRNFIVRIWGGGPLLSKWLTGHEKLHAMPNSLHL